MDAESKQQAERDVLAAAVVARDAYRKERRGLYKTFGLDELVKAFDALDDAVTLHEATLPVKALPEQVKLDLKEESK